MASMPLRMVCLACVVAACPAVLAQAPEARAGGWRPDRLFLQAGLADDAHTLVAGGLWERRWHRPFGGGRLGLYWEVSIGRWRGERDGQRGSAWVTQLGVTPVLRWARGAGGPGWFAEAGIGANLVLPRYRSGDKAFSTRFNFGDHLGIGRQFGTGGRHELSLRFQHFSNGGLRQPNPGEDFVQLRWSWRL